MVNGNVGGQARDAKNPQAHQQDDGGEDEEWPVFQRAPDLVHDGGGLLPFRLRHHSLMAFEGGDQCERDHADAHDNTDPFGPLKRVGKHRHLRRCIQPRNCQQHSRAPEGVERHQAGAFVVIWREGKS